MPGEGAVMNNSLNFALRDLLEARDLALQRLDVEIFDLGLRLRRVLLLGDVREAHLELLDQLGEFLEFAAAAALGNAAKA